MNEVWEFSSSLADDRLDEVFYASAERLGSILFSKPERHPLHANFSPPPPMTVRSLFGTKLVPQPLNFNREELHSAQQSRIDDHWRVIRSQPTYKRLFANADFKKAWNHFVDKQASKDEGYTHEYTQYRFLRIAAQQIGMSFVLPIKASNRPTKLHNKSATRHIEKLVNLHHMHGIGFDNFDKDWRLMELLRALLEHLAVQSTFRAKRDDETRAFRELIHRLTESFIRTFGEASPTIVENLAAAAGSPLDSRATLNHIGEVRKRMNAAKK